MSRYCLDTSAYSRFRMGERRLVEVLDAATWLGVSAIVLGELRAAFRQGGKREQNERLLDEFLANPVVTELAVDSAVSEHYADIVADLRQAGTPVPTNDMWIAATAARAGAILISYDDHFDHIKRVGSMILKADGPPR